MRIKKSLYFCSRFSQKTDVFFSRESEAEIAQLVEHDLAKVGVASSSLVFRSKSPTRKGKDKETLWWWNGRHEGLKIPCPQGRVGSSPTRSTNRAVDV